MAYNTKPIVKDKDGNPISQYYNPATDQYEPVEGQSGANKVVLYNSDGTENNSLSLIPILDKLSQLTGTVVDEETRKSNELQRQELYNQILNMLETGQLKGEKGDKGDTGIGLNFLWQGTSLGVKLETDAEYVFVDLRGPQGPAGTIEGLTSQHVTDALGYTPANETDLTNLAGEGRTTETVKKNADDIVSLNDNKADKKEIPDITVKLNKSGDTLENYSEKLVTLTGLTPDINLSQSNVFKLTLEGETTMSISNSSANVSQSFTLIIIQPATAYTVTFPANIKWMNETIPDLSTAEKTYYLLFDTIDGGTTWHGRFGGMF